LPDGPVGVSPAEFLYARQDARLPHRLEACAPKRAIDAGQYFFFAEHFEQMIKARTDVASGHSEASGMNDRADFDGER
jgi:hypothetical protein